MIIVLKQGANPTGQQLHDADLVIQEVPDGSFCVRKNRYGDSMILTLGAGNIPIEPVDQAGIDMIEAAAQATLNAD
jgi:hypothetical protein